MIVLVTIHGIGFQRKPTTPRATDGYADQLHTNLGKHLQPGVLGNDPERDPTPGPVYVQSAYPEATHKTEDGLSRLGSWQADGTIKPGKPLAADTASIAHVALIYTNLEEDQGDPIALGGLGVLSGPRLTHYAGVSGLVRMMVDDIRGAAVQPGKPSASLLPRSEQAPRPGIFNRLVHRSGDGPLSTLHQIEDDVAAYVVRNEHRERVRGFIRDAVSRILRRPGVEGVVINSHSNGTVMAFDLVAALSLPLASGVLALITAGSPLRKYVDFMDWGTDAGNFYFPLYASPDAAARSGCWWTNFFDQRDPVADPLQPPLGWKRVPDPPGSDGRCDAGMFVVFDPQTGEQKDVPVTDVVAHNVGHVGGGLPAHNYWDNDDPGEFCEQAAALLVAALDAHNRSAASSPELVGHSSTMARNDTTTAAP